MSTTTVQPQVYPHKPSNRKATSAAALQQSATSLTEERRDPQGLASQAESIQLTELGDGEVGSASRKPAPISQEEPEFATLPSESTVAIAAGNAPSGPESVRSSILGPSAHVETPLDKQFRWRQIVVCGAAFTIVFTTCGTVFAFGVFQELYQSMSLEPGNIFTGASPASIDMIGTLAVAFMTLGAPLATAWSKRFSPSAVIFGGGIMYFAANIGASYAQTVGQLCATQGFLMGLGVNFGYIPAVGVAPTWYTDRRALALGIITSGTGVGGLVWAPAMQALNKHFGWRMALRISGAISTAIIFAGAYALDWDPVTKARLKEENDRRRAKSKNWFASIWNVPLLDLRIARTSKFAAQLFANVMQSGSYYGPIFYFSAYASTLGYSAKQGANFIAISNAMNAVGKISMGLLADRYGRINMLVVSTVISMLASLVLWLPSTVVSSGTDARGLFVSYTIMYGIFSSAYIALFPASIAELFGPQNFASVNGVLYGARGLATLVTPAAGALLKHSANALRPRAYLPFVIFMTAFLVAATVGVIWVRLENRKAS